MNESPFSYNYRYPYNGNVDVAVDVAFAFADALQDWRSQNANSSMTNRLPILQSPMHTPKSDTHSSLPLPTVAALEALWQEVQSRPLWAPPNFFKYLKLRWRMRLRMVDPNRIAIVAPPGKVNDCSSCLDICCVGPRSTVLLRFRDIATLVDIGRADLMTHDKPRFQSKEIAQRPALRRQLASASWSTFPVLKQNSFGACGALTDDGKCSLYPHWPMACARFPYALHADDTMVFYSQRCDSFWIRSDAQHKVQAMAVAAVAAYNERIKDLVLLAYAPERLRELGLLQYLRH